MEINRTTMKREAKGLIAGTNPSPILVGLVFVFIVYVLNYLSTHLVGIQVNTDEYYNAMMSGDYAYFQRLIQSYHPGAVAWLLNFAIQVMVTILSAGFVIYVLNVVRHYTACFGNLFDSFSIFFRVLWLTILTGIFIFLWSLLLIIPGIIAAYRYRMALYLLLDNPNMSVYQCIRESKRMMVGHKAELLFSISAFSAGIYCPRFLSFPFGSHPIRRLPMPFITMHFAQILVTPDLWAPRTRWQRPHKRIKLNPAANASAAGFIQYFAENRFGFGRNFTPDTSPMAANSVTMDEPP